ncbi:MAG TPA: nucleoside 2-deoxyribosyltransferase [Gaiellaceae bacterium]|nr:nucleoside 2-deoxyribosyltransferase [Gaiellaceae bacterium]
MRVYLAGPLFSEAERAWLDAAAARLRAEGWECFVPHENFAGVTDLSAEHVYRVDLAGLRAANVLVAWLDGPAIDDGTAAEIGMFAEWCATRGDRYRGIVGVATDLRTHRRRGLEAGGLNLFVVGAIQSAGTICWSLDEAIEAVRALDREPGGEPAGPPPDPSG